MVNCTNCILDSTDACPRGAGRAVDDEICEKFISECDTCLFSTRKEKIDEAYQKGRADAIDEMLDAIAQEVAYSYKTLNYSKVAQIAEKLKEQK